MRILLLFLLSFFFNLPIQAEHQNEAYEPHSWKSFIVKGSDNYYKFESELIEDKSVKKEIKNTKKTGLISYLLFEDNKITIDEEDLPYKRTDPRFNNGNKKQSDTNDSSGCDRGMKKMAYKYGYGPNGKLTKMEMLEVWAAEEAAEAAEESDSDAQSAHCNQSPKHPVKVRRSKSLVDLTSPARKSKGKPAPLIDITLSPMRGNLARTEASAPCSPTPTPTPPSPPSPVSKRLRGRATKSIKQNQKTSMKDAKPEL